MNVKEKPYNANHKIALTLYLIIWQVCIFASTHEWPLLFIGLGATLVFTTPQNWVDIKKWWFTIDYWLIALSLTLLYTIIRHNVELNSYVLFAKRTILITISVLSLSKILTIKDNPSWQPLKRKSERLFARTAICISQTSITLLITAPFIKNKGSVTAIDEYLGIPGISQGLAMMFLLAASTLPLSIKLSRKNFIQSCLFSITSTILFAGSQSSITAGVMLGGLVYVLGYIHKSILVKNLGCIITRLWIVYYGLFLPLSTIAAPIIHDQAKGLAKLLYTVTGSRYSLAWSANLWHENGLNFLNKQDASSVFGFLSKSYFDADFTSLYGAAAETWNHNADVFVPGGAHSLPIALLLESNSLTLTIIATWTTLILASILLFKEYRKQVRNDNFNQGKKISVEIFTALTLSIIVAENIALSLSLLGLFTYVILISSDSSRLKSESQDLTRNSESDSYKNSREDIFDGFISFTSPIMIVAPFLIYTMAYILAKLRIFEYILKL